MKNDFDTLPQATREILALAGLRSVRLLMLLSFLLTLVCIFGDMQYHTQTKAFGIMGLILVISLFPLMVLEIIAESKYNDSKINGKDLNTIS